MRTAPYISAGNFISRVVGALDVTKIKYTTLLILIIYDR